MKINEELLKRIKEDYELRKQTSAPYLQSKFKVDFKLDKEIVEALNAVY